MPTETVAFVEPPVQVSRVDAGVDAGALIAATGRLVRLVQARGVVGHVADGLTLRVSSGTVTLSTSDGETHAAVEMPAVAAVAGEATVARRVFGDIAGALGSLRGAMLRIHHEPGREGSGRLVIESESARFALPLLDDSAGIGRPPSGTPAGRVDGAAFARLARLVAGATANVPGLPALGGVRLRTCLDRLVLDATDRFRYAHASLPWEPPADGDGAIDVLLGAPALERVARRVEATVGFEVSSDSLTLHWPGTRVRLAGLAVPYPDAQLARLLAVAPETTVDVDPAVLVAAVERAASGRGAARDVRLETGDGRLVVRGDDPAAGESVETIPAEVSGPPTAHRFNCDYLRYAVTSLAAPRGVRLAHQGGRRPTEITAVGATDDVRILVLSKRLD